MGRGGSVGGAAYSQLRFCSPLISRGSERSWLKLSHLWATRHVVVEVKTAVKEASRGSEAVPGKRKFPGAPAGCLQLLQLLQLANLRRNLEEAVVVEPPAESKRGRVGCHFQFPRAHRPDESPLFSCRPSLSSHNHLGRHPYVLLLFLVTIMESPVPLEPNWFDQSTEVRDAFKIPM